jgi:hypothetical protein
MKTAPVNHSPGPGVVSMLFLVIFMLVLLTVSLSAYNPGVLL